MGGVHGVFPQTQNLQAEHSDFKLPMKLQFCVITVSAALKPSVPMGTLFSDLFCIPLRLSFQCLCNGMHVIV